MRGIALAVTLTVYSAMAMPIAPANPELGRIEAECSAHFYVMQQTLLSHQEAEAAATMGRLHGLWYGRSLRHITSAEAGRVAEAVRAADARGSWPQLRSAVDRCLTFGTDLRGNF